MMFFRKLCRNTVVPSSTTENSNLNGPTIAEHTQRNFRQNQCGGGQLLFSSNNLPEYNSIPTTPPPSYSSSRPTYPDVNIVRYRHRNAALQNVEGFAPVIQVQQRYVTGGESSTTSSDYDEIDDNDVVGNNQRSRWRQPASRLNRVHCPDLLHACSLILPSQQQETDSSTDQLNSSQERELRVEPEPEPDLQLRLEPESEINYQIQTNQNNSHNLIKNQNLNLLSRRQPISDYAEIDEICLQLSHLERNATNSRSIPEQLNLEIKENFNTNNVEQCVNDWVTSSQAMGQNLSLRRPRLSLTWVLREQQQQQSQQHSQQTQQQQHSQQQQQPQHENTTQKKDQHQPITNQKNNNAPIQGNIEIPIADQKKKYKIKPKNDHQLLFTEKYVTDHNLQQYPEKREPSKDLLFVCTPQKQPINNQYDEATILKRQNDIKRNLERKTFKLSENNVLDRCEKDETKSLKGTYSEPSLIAASEGNHRRHRHRKRRDRNRMQKFGYEIRNVDEFLTKCSLASPGNIPVVLSAASTLYQTRPGGYQIEIPLPLGMVVNAVFKNQNWLYVQTPHAEEGYVGYSTCLPLGILPPPTRSGTATSKPTRCWETNGDVFPRPCGNMTDSEKEIRLRGGTRSDGARTPRLRRTLAKHCGEHHVDNLYLRAASQPKLTEKTYAQLKTTNSIQKKSHLSRSSPKVNGDEYVVLQQQKQTKIVQRQCVQNAVSKTKSLRQTLVAITNDYATDSITVHKGEIVTLVECRESKDHRQWFYIKTRDGREGFIPAEFAGHGFL